MSECARSRTVVIGCGNVLGADDGVGIVALDQLREWQIPEEVELEDGGTWGLNLLPLIENADRLLVLDAVDVSGAAGRLVTLERDQIPKYFSTKLSPHQIDLREVLALAAWRGTLPGETVVMGLQPARMEMSTELSPEVAAGVSGLVAAAAARLARWGHEVSPPAEVAGA